MIGDVLEFRPHDPECECDARYLCATQPGSWCRTCGHARSQHYANGVCSCSCNCYKYKGPGIIVMDNRTPNVTPLPLGAARGRG